MTATRSRSLAKPVLAHVADQIDEISTLPHVAMRIMGVASDPDSGAADLKEVMEGDPAFTARVLRCVNSSAYATRQRITNLQHAVAYLGVKQIRNMATMTSVSELFRTPGGIGPYSREGLWRHMVSVAIGARMIALRLGLPDCEDIFLAGLMHDIGIVLEDQFAHQHFCRMIAKSLDEERTLTQCERLHFIFDHTTLGERVAQGWRFPPLVCAAIRHHHHSLQYEGDDKAAVCCVEIANLICSVKGITSVGLNLVRYIDPEDTPLELHKNDLVVLAGELDGELRDHRGLFDV